MELLFITIGAICTLTFILLPAFLAGIKRKEAEWQTAWYCTQLRVIRKAHPELQELRYREIAERYDVSAVYDSIGRGNYWRSRL